MQAPTACPWRPQRADVAPLLLRVLAKAPALLSPTASLSVRRIQAVATLPRGSVSCSYSSSVGTDDRLAQLEYRRLADCGFWGTPAGSSLPKTTNRQVSRAPGRE